MQVMTLQTEHPCYVQLSDLQSQKTPIDVLAVILTTPIIHKQAEPSCGNYAAILYVSDMSTPKHTTCVIVYHSDTTALPQANEGDCVLLRNFVVESAHDQLYLQSCGKSAWCVFTGGESRYWSIIEREEARRLHAWWKSGCP
jgi:hypothetical protein